MKLLLISNSTNYKEPYLGWCQPLIAEFLEGTAKNIAFLPYAGVDVGGKVYPASYDAYTERAYRGIYVCVGPNSYRYATPNGVRAATTIEGHRTENVEPGTQIENRKSFIYSRTNPDKNGTAAGHPRRHNPPRCAG